MTRAERVEEALGLLRDAMLAEDGSDEDDAVPSDVVPQIRRSLNELRSQADRMESAGETWQQSTGRALDRAGTIVDALTQRNRDLSGVCERFAGLCDRLEDALFRASKKRAKK